MFIIINKRYTPSIPTHKKKEVNQNALSILRNRCRNRFLRSVQTFGLTAAFSPLHVRFLPDLYRNNKLQFQLPFVTKAFRFLVSLFKTMHWKLKSGVFISAHKHFGIHVAESLLNFNVLVKFLQAKPIETDGLTCQLVFILLMAICRRKTLIFLPQISIVYLFIRQIQHNLIVL